MKNNNFPPNSLFIDDEMIRLKSILLRQNKVIKELTERLLNLTKELNQLKSTNFFDSTRNQGVNQSINHLNTSLNTQKNLDELEVNKLNKNVSTRNQGAKETLSHSFLGIGGQFRPDLEIEPQDEVFHLLKDRINSTFSLLSKQELKVFLTIYQLIDDEIDTSYRNIADRMDLSEHCIRAHICSLFRKKAPLYKAKINNRLTLIFVKKEFKVLDLKKKIINLYYQNDPYQKTLLDI